MRKILIFGGTTEGRELAQTLAKKAEAQITVCVATQYGSDMFLQRPANIEILVGRRDALQIAELMSQGFDCAVDATHPYAVEITNNINVAAEKFGLKVLRLIRRASDFADVLYVESAQQAADILQNCVGNILLTTGSKELEVFTSVDNFAERIYPRVLPCAEAIEKCEKLGFRRANVIAMQGPFSKELNCAIIHEFDIKNIITKDGGKQGGFTAKIEAARANNAKIITIGRPSIETGLSSKEIVSIIEND